MKRLKIKILLYFFFSIFACVNLQAQLSKTHYIPPLVARDNGNATPNNQYLYISTPSTDDVNIRIIEVGGDVITTTASNASPRVVDIGTGENTQLFMGINQTNIIQNDKGYIIEADDLVYVTIKILGGDGNPQAGAIVSKGLSGLGKEFRVGMFNNPSSTTGDTANLSFLSIIATENNTSITISNLPSDLNYHNNPFPGNNSDLNFTLNNGESRILAIKTDGTKSGGVLGTNADGLIGVLVSSNKNIAVNTGSTSGTAASSGQGRDYGIDQIVPIERIGTDYIFTRGYGDDDMESVILVAHEDNTEVFIGTDVLATTTINAGEYYSIEGNRYSSSSSGANMAVTTSKPVYAYQAVGGTNNTINQGMFFVPPINCATPNIVDNIPAIEKVGNIDFTGGMSILFEGGESVKINGTDIESLGPDITVKGPFIVLGNADFETYFVEGLTGNITVESAKQVYVAAFGANGSAAFGGYYSGFAFKPEILFESAKTSSTGNCLPNVSLKLSDNSSYDDYQWYKDGVAIPGANNIDFSPTSPGYYKVEATITCTGFKDFSDEIPVSLCAEDNDNDGTVDAIDIDNDNDGILNCTESLGRFGFDLVDETVGSFAGGTYNFTGNATTKGNSSITPFLGADDGRFVMSIPAGVKDTVSYKTTFDTPLNIKLEYPDVEFGTDALLTNDELFAISVPPSSTISIYNPDNQLLIDTNYDGIYESGVTHFSAFEVRFSLNAESLSFGAGTFSIAANQIDELTIIYKNNTDTKENKATLKLSANCLPLDSDGDSIPDHLDLDSENDGVPDLIENFGILHSSINTTDTNKDGLYDIFNISSSELLDIDKDAIANYLDLDSDNDGIYDLVESNSNATDISKDGIVDGLPISFGTNGLANSLETTADNGDLNYNVADTDNDTIPNFLALDSDDDNCNDVIEAGFSDDDGDGYLGIFPLITDKNGIITSGTDGYTTPNNNYTISAPIKIETIDVPIATCENEIAVFNIETLTTGVSWKWQLSTDGTNWIDIADDLIYSGTNSNKLSIQTSIAMDEYKYRAQLSKVGNTCGLTSQEITLNLSTAAAIDFMEIDPICLNEGMLQLTATPTGGEYTASPSDIVSTNGIFDPLKAGTGTHKVIYTFTNTAGCISKDSINIVVNPLPIATVEPTQTFCSATEIPTIADLKITSTGAKSVSWFDSPTGGVALDLTEELIHNKAYYAEVTNANDCKSFARTETIAFVANPEITATEEEVCIGDSTILKVSGIPQTAEDFIKANPDLTLITQYKDSRYFVRQQSMSWEAANALGDALPGASMYIINDTTEETTVYNALQAMGLTGSNDNISYWFGLRQLSSAPDFSETSGGWYWVDGSPLTYTNWAPNEPNDWPNPGVDNEENYGQFEFGNNGIRWNDIPNSSSNGNSYPLFEFTGTTDVVWGRIDPTAPDGEVLFPDKTTEITVSPTEDTTYFIRITTNGEECTDQITIKAVDKPIVIIDPIAPLCANDASFQIVANITGIVFSGDGITDASGIFDPSKANIGQNGIQYDYTSSSGCSTSGTFDITVHDIPTLTTNDSEICNGDTINLSTLITSTAETVNYFLTNPDTSSGISIPISPEVTPNTTTSYFVKAINTSTNCTIPAEEIIITVNALPELTNPTDLIQCNEDLNSITTFDLTIKESEISTNYLTETFTYFEKSTGNEISSPESYAGNNGDIVVIYVKSDKDCEALNPVELKLLITRSQIPDTFSVPTFHSCDDNLDIDGNNTTNNDNTDGISSFDFSSAEALILAQLPDAQYTTTYYRNEEDAKNLRNPIDKNSFSNYRNTNSKDTQHIWTHITSNINKECVAFGTYITLIVDPIPESNTVDNIFVCENNIASGFDLSSKISGILGTQSSSDFSVSFHESSDDATNGNNALPAIYTGNFTNEKIIYVRVVDNTTGCVNPNNTFKLVIESLPISNISAISGDLLEQCDDEIVDGKVKLFDLEAIQQAILGNQDASQFEITLHQSQANAETKTNPIPTNELYENTIPEQETIYVRIENLNTTNTCANTTTSFNLIVHKTPNFEVVENEQIVCIDDPNGLKLSALNPGGNYEYEWKDSEGTIVGNTQEINIFNGGTYSVVATIPNATQCPSAPKSIKVTESSAPTIVKLDISDGTNFEGDNSIMVFVTGEGDYEYKIDDGDYQDQSKIQDVGSGIHSITVNDKNGCGTDTETDIAVLTFNRFFSPDGDTINPTWSLIDKNTASSFTFGLIKIFDRHGNLLKILNPLLDEKWDGTFNGKQMPATDYWFSVELKDKNGKTIIRTGNFSLIR